MRVLSEDLTDSLGAAALDHIGAPNFSREVSITEVFRSVMAKHR